MMIGLLQSKNDLLLKAQKVGRPEDQSELALEPSSGERSDEEIPKCQKGDSIVVGSSLSFLIPQRRMCPQYGSI